MADLLLKKATMKRMENVMHHHIFFLLQKLRMELVFHHMKFRQEKIRIPFVQGILKGNGHSPEEEKESFYLFYP